MSLTFIYGFYIIYLQFHAMYCWTKSCSSKVSNYTLISCSIASKSQMHACIMYAKIQKKKTNKQKKKNCHTTKQIKFHMANCSKTGYICIVVNLKSLKLSSSRENRCQHYILWTKLEKIHCQ